MDSRHRSSMNLQVFKNGYALVSKSCTLPEIEGEGSASVSLGKPPKHACHGTLWLTAGKDTTILGMRTESSTAPVAAPCTTVPSLLTANVGSAVAVKLHNNRDGWLEGKVVNVAIERVSSGLGAESAGKGLLILQCQDSGKDEVKVVPLQDIVEVRGSTGEFKISKEEKQKKQEVVVDYRGAGGTASLMHLRSGFCWAPSYHWQLQDGQKATLNGNATIMNESEEGGVFEKLQCVVGAPNMKFGHVHDPLLVASNISQFLSQLSGADERFGGGFGGGLGGGREGMQMLSQAPLQTMSTAFGAGSFGAAPGGGGGGGAGDEEEEFVTVPAEGLAAATDDVHFLEFENVRLDPHARIALPVFSAEASYADVFRASLPAGSGMGMHGRQGGMGRAAGEDASKNMVLDVWRALRITNQTAKPWTTAPVMITKGGRFIAQGTVAYTPVGADALVNVTRALNIRCKYQTQISDGGTEVVMGKNCGARVHKTTITVNNGKPMPVELVVDFETEGQLLDATVAPRKNVEVPSVSHNDLNHRRDLQFVVQLPPQGNLEIVFRCKLLYKREAREAR